MKAAKVIFRADGNKTIGLGHIYRSLAVAEMLKADFECLFFIKNPDESVSTVIQKSCTLFTIDERITLHQEPDFLKPHIDNNTIVVIDGYHFDSIYQKELKAFTKVLIAIDDKATIHFYADLIINHGDNSIISSYKKENYSKVLAGFSYALLRPEFAEAAKTTRYINQVSSLFICLGGADPFNITNKIVKAALKCDYLNRIVIVTGSAYRHLEQLKALIKGAKKEIAHESDVSAAQMVGLIQQCDIAVSSASSIAIEICSVRAGLLTGMVIDNQHAIYQQLINHKCALGMNDFNAATDKELKELLEQLSDLNLVRELVINQQKAIDGYSNKRILVEIKKLVA